MVKIPAAQEQKLRFSDKEMQGSKTDASIMKNRLLWRKDLNLRFLVIFFTYKPKVDKVNNLDRAILEK